MCVCVWVCRKIYMYTYVYIYIYTYISGMQDTGGSAAPHQIRTVLSRQGLSKPSEDNTRSLTFTQYCHHQ